MTRSSQIGMKTFTFATLLVAIVLTVLATGAVQANAESSVYNQPTTNVFFRYGVGPALASEGRTNVTEAYNESAPHGFYIVHSMKFGGLHVGEGKVSAEYVGGERIVATAAEYELADGENINFSEFSGHSSLPLVMKFDLVPARLIYVIIGVHSNQLPNQPPRLEK